MERKRREADFTIRPQNMKATRWVRAPVEWWIQDLPPDADLETRPRGQ